jgi:hypothetical protein
MSGISIPAAPRHIIFKVLRVKWSLPKACRKKGRFFSRKLRYHLKMLPIFAFKPQ